jgi:hypothetical protein
MAGRIDEDRWDNQFMPACATLASQGFGEALGSRAASANMMEWLVLVRSQP